MRSEVLTAMKMSMLVFWVVAPSCSTLKIETVDKLVSTYKSTRRYKLEDQHRHLEYASIC
jgi:hypothetical protein